MQVCSPNITAVFTSWHPTDYIDQLSKTTVTCVNIISEYILGEQRSLCAMPLSDLSKGLFEKGYFSCNFITICFLRNNGILIKLTLIYHSSHDHSLQCGSKFHRASFGVVGEDMLSSLTQSFVHTVHYGPQSVTKLDTQTTWHHYAK